MSSGIPTIGALPTPGAMRLFSLLPPKKPSPINAHPSDRVVNVSRDTSRPVENGSPPNAEAAARRDLVIGGPRMAPPPLVAPDDMVQKFQTNRVPLSGKKHVLKKQSRSKKITPLLNTDNGDDLDKKRFLEESEEDEDLEKDTESQNPGKKKKKEKKLSKRERCKQIILCPFYALWRCLRSCFDKCSLFAREVVWNSCQSWCVCVLGIPTICCIVSTIIVVIIYAYGIARLASGLASFAIETPGKVLAIAAGPTVTPSPTIM